MIMNTEIVTAEKIVPGGKCISKIDGKIVFIPDAIPGEKLEIEIVSQKGDYLDGKINRILEPSAHRITPSCPYFGKCGGCNMSFMDDDFQKECRKNIIKDTFQKQSPDINLQDIIIESGKSFGYRNRFQFHSGGMMGKESNDIIPIKDCPVAVPKIRELLQSGELQNLKSKKERVHVFADDKNLVIAEENEKPRGKFSGTLLNEKNLFTAEINGRKIQFDVQGFFQSNIEMLSKTINKVCYNMGGEKVLDIYSGVGTFSSFLTDYFNEVFLVEHNRDAIVLAEKNLSGTKHFSYGISGERWTKLKEADRYFDAIVVDPPRSGLEKSVCKYLCSKKVPQIRYVSCNPVTLARDANELTKHGYNLQKLYMLDYYPQTSHVECLAYFEYLE